MRSIRRLACVGVGVALAVLPRIAHAAGTSYVALGDSYAYGYQSAAITPPIGFPQGGSDGYQGYVSQFASYLGLSPSQVLNLARPGETTASYTTSTAGPEAPFNFNTNYAPGTFSQSQLGLFDSTFPNAVAGAGVRYVTIQLGGNDILGLLSQPGFVTQSQADQLNAITAAFTTLQSNYATILSHVQATLPNAQIYILGYPNPFAGLTSNPFTGPDAGTELATLQADAAIATAQADSLFGTLAAGLGPNAHYVELAQPFQGHEADWTLINSTDPGTSNPDYHPNSAGYNQIALTLESAAAPEPGSLALLLLPLGGATIGIIRRRKRVARQA